MNPRAKTFYRPALLRQTSCEEYLRGPEFAAWLTDFFPTLVENIDMSWLVPAVVTDKSDGKLAHLDGLNISRAWMLEGIISGLPTEDMRLASLRAVVEAHRKAGSTLFLAICITWEVIGWKFCYLSFKRNADWLSKR